MDILYAPWRDKYITDSKKELRASESDCVFCHIFVSKDSAQSSNESFILKETQHAFIILNLYPYNGGHVLILPRQHSSQLEDVTSDVRKELMELMSATIVILKNVLKADGINAGINLGRASGAGIPEHFHFHVVPRWFGDTSFITTIGHTKNVSVDLQRIYQDLKPAFQALEI